MKELKEARQHAKEAIKLVEAVLGMINGFQVTTPLLQAVSNLDNIIRELREAKVSEL